MLRPKLEEIINASDGLRAHQIVGDDLVSLSHTGTDPTASARQMKHIWAGLLDSIPDAQTLYAKNGDTMTLASHKGGVIVEAEAPFNVGLLRLQLNEVEAGQQPKPSALQPPSAPGTRALFALADWLEGIEADRAIVIGVGGTQHPMWARKGRFALPDGVAPQDMARAVLAVNHTKSPVTMTYEDLPSTCPVPSHDPISLFMTDSAQAGPWSFDEDGLLLSAPKPGSLNGLRRALEMRDRLLSWGQGNTFAVSILREGGPPQVVATSDGEGSLRLADDVWI